MKRFYFVLLPRFSLVSFSCAIDALRGANQVLSKAYYHWHAVSAEGGNMPSSSSITAPTNLLEDVESPDVIVLCGGDQSHNYSNPVLSSWLHKKAQGNTRIGSISDGSFVAADVGLFDKVPSTIHWKCFDAYRERFPKLDVKPSIMEISDKRFSCAGGTASLDLMLQFISEDHGTDVSSQIANNYFHDTIRDASREQHVTNAFRLASRSPIVAQALLLMEDNLETPLTISDIAEKLELSHRQFNRVFKRDFDLAPQVVYRNLRLARAAGLLLQTNIGVTEIAVGCGFQSASHLGKYFKQLNGVTPGAYRKQNSPY